MSRIVHAASLLTVLSVFGCTLSDRLEPHWSPSVPLDAAAPDASRDASTAPDATTPDAARNASRQDASQVDAREPLHPFDAAIPDDDAGTEGPLLDGMPIADFFAGSCGPCHGANRQGGLGPTLIPSRLTKPRDFYAQTITNGRPGTFMPMWGDRLSPHQIDKLVTFLFTEPALDAIEWEMPQITGSAFTLVEESTLPKVPTHTGNIDNLMLVTERDANKIAVIDGDTHTVLGHVTSSYQAHGYAFDPKHPRWVYNMGRDGWIFKIDLFTLQAVRGARVGVDSRGLAISDDGKYLIAGNYWPATMVILEAATLKPLKVLHAHGLDPDAVEVDSRVTIVSDVAPALVGPYFIVGLKEAGQVWRIDYSKPDFPVSVVRNVGHELHDGFLSPDNKRFYIASQGDDWMAVIDVQAWKLIDLIPTGQTPHPGSGATWSSGGHDYGATVHAGEGKISIWDLATNNIVGQITTSGPGLFIRSHEQSPYVWADAMMASAPHEITVFDGTSPTFNVVARLTDGTQTLHPEFTADASFVYVADWKENVVRVYDAHYDVATSTFPLVTTITGITTPTGIFSTHRRVETLGH